MIRIVPEGARTQGVSSALSRFAKVSPIPFEYYFAAGVYIVKRKATANPERPANPGRCPRCDGQMIRTDDGDGPIVKCMACSYEPPTNGSVAPVRSRGPAHAGARI